MHMPPRQIALDQPRDLTAILYTDASWEVDEDGSVCQGLGSVLACKNADIHAH